MIIEEKIQAVDEKIISLESTIHHVLLRDVNTGINYDDPVEMQMIDKWVKDTQNTIELLTNIKLEILAGNAAI